MMDRVVHLLLSLLCLGGGAAAVPPTNRAEKAFSVFEIVKFDNGPCATNDSLTGSCYTAAECEKLGGEAAGTCANSFGTCCKFILTSGSTKENNTYFASSGTFSEKSQVEVCPLSEDIRFFRIDFNVLNIAGPDTTKALDIGSDGQGGAQNIFGWTSHPNTHGQCNTDSFRVTGSTGRRRPPVICGENRGQHIYVETDGEACITMTITRAEEGSQNWNIQVGQIEAGQAWSPPQDCLQYHTGETGTLDSFNIPYNHHLADQYYDICIRKEDGMCAISYEASVFQVSAVGHTNNFGTGPGRCNSVNLLAERSDVNDQLQLGNDWIEIPLGHEESSTAITYDRFCGRQLHTNETSSDNVPIISTKRPFRVGVHFDSSEHAGTHSELGFNSTSASGDSNRGDVGFSIGYTQVAC